MSGIVIEAKGKHIIVLTNKGDFKKQKNIQNLNVGDEYHVNHVPSRLRRYMAIAATFLFVVFSFYGLDSYYTPFGHLNVDINPSIDITYNKYLRVIDIRGINDDGIEFATSLKSLKHDKVKDVVDDIVDEATDLKYLKGTEEDYILLSVSDDEDKLDVNEFKVKNASAIKYKSTKEEYDIAKKNGVSPGKVKLVKKIEVESKGYAIKELNKDIKEIKIQVLMKSYNDMKKENREKNVDKENNSNKKNENSNNNKK